MRDGQRLGRELRRARLVGGGWGACILVSTEGNESLWLTREACEACVRAAVWMGFGFGAQTWSAVVQAIAAGCIEDVLSYAIEEVESDGGEREAIAAE